MFRKHNTFNLFYFLILVLNVYALATGNQLLRMIAMPLIGMSLILYFLISTKIESSFHKLIFFGLVLSLAGDIQLLFTTGAGFYLLTALIAILISYALNAIAYFEDFKTNLNQTRRIGNVFFFVLLLTNVSFYFSATNNLEDFQYPVIAYFLVLTAMAVLSAYRHKRVNKTSFRLILTGSFAFVVSDLSMGYYHFIEAERIMMISYLLTYLVAQYLVVMGAIERRLVLKH